MHCIFTLLGALLSGAEPRAWPECSRCRSCLATGGPVGDRLHSLQPGERAGRGQGKPELQQTQLSGEAGPTATAGTWEKRRRGRLQPPSEAAPGPAAALGPRDTPLRGAAACFGLTALGRAPGAWRSRQTPVSPREPPIRCVFSSACGSASAGRDPPP